MKKGMHFRLEIGDLQVVCRANWGCIRKFG